LAWQVPDDPGEYVGGRVLRLDPQRRVQFLEGIDKTAFAREPRGTAHVGGVRRLCGWRNDGLFL
jgi:hypothetical protein